MKRLQRRLTKIARALPPPKRVVTPEMRLAFCLEHGLDPNSVLVGFEEGVSVVVLPPEEDL
jgi:hypothetical protein